MTLQLGRGSFLDTDLLVMAIVNRTPDSFFDKGASWADDAAMERVHRVVAEGADIIDIGGVKAGPGDYVSPEEEARRTVPFIAAVRDAYPDIVISVDTWRHEVGRAACEVGADILNDAWGGVDPDLAVVAAEFSAAIVCTHTGGAEPRTRPHRVAYDNVMDDIIARTTALADRASTVGVPREGIIIDPGHDFGKNTWHSLEATRRIDEMVATGWPVLISTSNKDFVGETLNRPVDQRLLGSLASVAVTAYAGARIFRVHAVAETREVLDMVASILGTREPSHTVRGLA
jgi:dihydropteroate synthase